MKKGWIRLHRKSLENFLYKEPRPLTKREAWENILLQVNYESERVLIGNEVVNCEEGQSVKSRSQWAQEFRWTKSKTSRFFKLLEKENMIKLENLEKTTRLTVLNWESYQGMRITDEPQTDRKRTGDNIINKEYNNIKEKYKKEKKSTAEFRKEVIEYLNEKTGKSFKATARKNMDRINARFNEGYSIEDFKHVIDVKSQEWLNDEKMEKYLCPETLFSPKFEKYLNQKLIDRSNGQNSNKKQPIRIADLEQSARDFEATYGTGSFGGSSDG